MKKFVSHLGKVTAVLYGLIITSPDSGAHDLKPWTGIFDETAIMAAVDRGDLSYVTAALSQGLSVQKVDHKGRSLLERACARGHKDLVIAFLNAGADVNYQNPQGYTALYWACQEKHFGVTSVLLSQGANPNLIPLQGLSPLYLASRNNDGPVISLLCQAGAHLSFTSPSQETALWIAAKKGHLEALKLLLPQSRLNEDTADLIHQGDDKGISPLLITCYQGHNEAASFLLEQGANPNQARNTGITPLMVACAQGQERMVQQLLSRGADVLQRASAQVGGGTALDYAQQHQHDKLLTPLKAAQFQQEEEQIFQSLKDFKTFSKSSKVTPHLQEALASLKAHVEEGGENWIAGIPTTNLEATLTPSEQQALQKVDQIIADYNQKYGQSLATLSRFAQMRQKVSKAVSKAFQVTKEAVQGPEINSVIKLQRTVNDTYGQEILKLNHARLEENHKKRLAALCLTHQHQEKELERQQEDIRVQLKAAPQRRLELRLQEKEIANQLAAGEEQYHVTLARLQNPVYSALEDFYDWKRAVFYDFTKMHLGTYLITYEALALGTVARHPEAYEYAVQGTTTLASLVSDAFLPLGGLLGNVIGTVAQTGAALYADKQMRLKAAKIGSLYEYKGLEGMVELSRNIAEGLLYRLKEAILPLTPESLEKLAKIANIQMIDYALKQWENNEQQMITPSDLLLRSTQHQPSWFTVLTQTAILETDEGQTLDGWALLTQAQQIQLDAGRFKRAARSFAKQARKNGANFISYAHTGTSVISGLIGS
ncbi:MAG: ankyrin repeat domain-containing protein [Candidatus Paracaedibacteraceae bacterium]|nr:ankyrin repeat domain-containing protein [Candidatus Paracaedibacteraceae bacterium]